MARDPVRLIENASYAHSLLGNAIALGGNDFHEALSETACSIGLEQTVASPFMTSASGSTMLESNLPPNSLEEQGQQRPELFNPSELDFFLEQQSRSSQPTHGELLKHQNWGHVDPRKVWPQHRSAEWLEAKRKEIEARSGRKANYGKQKNPGKERESDGSSRKKSKAAHKGFKELWELEQELNQGVHS